MYLRCDMSDLDKYFFFFWGGGGGGTHFMKVSICTCVAFIIVAKLFRTMI